MFCSVNANAFFDMSSLRGVGNLAFHRKKPPAIGVKAPCPGFIEPELAMSVDKVPPVAFSNKATRGRNRPTA